MNSEGFKQKQPHSNQSELDVPAAAVQSNNMYNLLHSFTAEALCCSLMFACLTHCAF